MYRVSNNDSDHYRVLPGFAWLARASRVTEFFGRLATLIVAHAAFRSRDSHWISIKKGAWPGRGVARGASSLTFSPPRCYRVFFCVSSQKILFCTAFSSSGYRVFLGFTEFYRVFLGFTDLYRVLPSFSCFYRFLPSLTEFYRVLPSFTVFFLVLPIFTEPYRVLSSFSWFFRSLPSFTECYRVLPSFTEYFLVLPIFTEPYQVLPIFSWFYRVLPSFS